MTVESTQLLFREKVTSQVLFQVLVPEVNVCCGDDMLLFNIFINFNLSLILLLILFKCKLVCQS